MDETLTVRCASCRDEAVLRAGALHMTIFDSAENSYYSFFCPHCTEESRHELNEDLELLLARFGVRLTLIHVPLEVLESKDGPAISPDDVMDFVLELQDLDGIPLALLR